MFTYALSSEAIDNVDTIVHANQRNLLRLILSQCLAKDATLPVLNMLGTLDIDHICHCDQTTKPCVV
jgi:hypothetical protein